MIPDVKLNEAGDAMEQVMIVPNLDALDVSDLDACAQAFTKLAFYCELRSLAAKHRTGEKLPTGANGSIANALLIERQADTVYRELPLWAKW